MSPCLKFVSIHTASSKRRNALASSGGSGLGMLCTDMPWETWAFALFQGPFASRVHTDHRNAVIMPEGLRFDEAASMPMLSMTAYLALVDVSRLQRGQSILIYAAGGRVG